MWVSLQQRHLFAQRAYFDRIRLNHLERVVRVYNAEGAELLRGELGRFLRDTDKVYSCLARHERKDAYCMEWMGRARLYLQYEKQSKARTRSAARQTSSNLF